MRATWELAKREEERRERGVDEEEEGRNPPAFLLQLLPDMLVFIDGIKCS